MTPRNLTECLFTTVFLSLAATAASAQTGGGWTIERTPGADLWFHAFAIIGLEGPGGVQLYNSAYADRIAELKSERGVSTILDELSFDLRGAMDQVGESGVLNYVQLYFAAA